VTIRHDRDEECRCCDAARAEILMLRERVRNAETSLAIYDDSGDGEYWLHYPEKMIFN